MLNDPKEIEIIAKARQKNVRDPKRPRKHFHRIFDDFSIPIRPGGDYIDLGAGQFDFADIVQSRGGHCLGVDNDPAVIELGKHKGVQIIQFDIKRLPELGLEATFDGLFNKFTINAFWHWPDDARHRQIIDAIAEMVRSDGWGWIAPWNGVPKKENLEYDEITRILEFQKDAFQAHGFAAVPLTARQSAYYGISGNVANNVIFCKNLTWKGRPL